MLPTSSAKRQSETKIFIVIEPIANDENRKNVFRFIHIGTELQLRRVPIPRAFGGSSTCCVANLVIRT